MRHEEIGLKTGVKKITNEKAVEQITFEKPVTLQSSY
jgi:hypothetical protein